MSQDIDQAVRRTRQYWFDDGLTEIGAAILFLAIGFLFLVETYAQPGSLPDRFSGLGIVVLVGGGGWLVSWAVRSAKKRITYPRTGYVRYRQPERPPRGRILMAALAIVVSASTAGILVLTSPASQDWIPALEGVSIGLYLLYMAYVVGMTRLYVLSGFSFVAGLGASLTGFGGTQGNGIYLATMGVVLLLSGTTAFLGYLRHTQSSEAE